MKVSLNPTYLCNFDCSFCYLTKDQLRDPTMIELPRLYELLKEVDFYRNIEAIDLYGGEVGLLSPEKWYALKQTIRSAGYEGPINVITNLSKIHPGFLDEDIDLSVSYDFSARQAHKSVRNNMFALEREFSVLILASKEVLAMDVDQMINELNLFKNLISVEIKPYSTNQANADDVSFSDFEEFVKRWLNSSVTKKFVDVNLCNIQESVSWSRYTWSSDHVYITPQGSLGVLEFDSNDNEYFLPIKNMDAYWNWTKAEQSRVLGNAFCSGCPYVGSCLSEHLRDVKSLDNSCNGFRHLLDWYKDERMAGTSSGLPSAE